MSSQMQSIDTLANPVRELWLNPADWARIQQTRKAQAAEIKKQNRQRIMERVRQLAQAEVDKEAGKAVPHDEVRIHPADWSRLYEQAEAELQKEDEDFEDDVETSPMSVEEGLKELVRPQPEIIDLTSEAGSPMDVGSSPAADSPRDLASPDDDEKSGLVFQETLTAPGTYFCTICGGTYKDYQAFEQHIKDDRFKHGYLDCSF
ncbi:hypothetical protein Slin14017_G123120 [Septoria linicola]|nr:hypothetical protein Slin14017_G123120 [Septoria linicola]